MPPWPAAWPVSRCTSRWRRSNCTQWRCGQRPSRRTRECREEMLHHPLRIALDEYVDPHCSLGLRHEGELKRAIRTRGGPSDLLPRVIHGHRVNERGAGASQADDRAVTPTTGLGWHQPWRVPRPRCDPSPAGAIEVGERHFVPVVPFRRERTELDTPKGAYRERVNDRPAVPGRVRARSPSTLASTNSPTTSGAESGVAVETAEGSDCGETLGNGDVVGVGAVDSIGEGVTASSVAHEVPKLAPAGGELSLRIRRAGPRRGS